MERFRFLISRPYQPKGRGRNALAACIGCGMSGAIGGATMTKRPVLEFWYEFASTYSYLSAMRIEKLAEAAGVEIRWRPFLLGPVFASNGWTTSPFNLYPAKGRHMWRDMERETARLGPPPLVAQPVSQNPFLGPRVA